MIDTLVLCLVLLQLMPLFLRLVHWGVQPSGATSAVTKQEVAPERVSLARRITFFRAMLTLTQRLKAIFVPFFGHFWSHFVQELRLAARCAQAAGKVTAQADDDSGSDSDNESGSGSGSDNGSGSGSGSDSGSDSDGESASDTDMVAAGEGAGAGAGSGSNTVFTRVHAKATGISLATAPAVLHTDTEPQSALIEESGAPTCYHTLRCFVLRAFAALLQNDADAEFMDSEKFEAVSSALVQQLSISPARLSKGGKDAVLGSVPGDEAAVAAFLDSYVVPCITQLAVVMNDEAYWKPLHHQVRVGGKRVVEATLLLRY